MELALQGLQKSIAAGRLKGRNKIERRLGKIQARHAQVNDLFEVALRDMPEGVGLVWEIKKEGKTWRDLREGTYRLRHAPLGSWAVIGETPSWMDGIGSGTKSRYPEKFPDATLGWMPSVSDSHPRARSALS
jgi:hypothetical protein